MKKLHLLGIGIPALFIFLVILTGILNIGITIESNSPISISKQEIFPANHSGEVIGPSIRTIKIKNNFILQRREEINFAICILGKDNYPYQTLGYYPYINGQKQDNRNSHTININPGETKIIEIKPVNYKYNYKTNIGDPTYQNATELMIFPTQTNYYSCNELINENYNKGISIKLV